MSFLGVISMEPRAAVDPWLFYMGIRGNSGVERARFTAVQRSTGGGGWTSEHINVVTLGDRMLGKRSS
jgi:hypothetical protein